MSSLQLPIVFAMAAIALTGCTATSPENAVAPSEAAAKSSMWTEISEVVWTAPSLEDRTEYVDLTASVAGVAPPLQVERAEEVASRLKAVCLQAPTGSHLELRVTGTERGLPVQLLGVDVPQERAARERLAQDVHRRCMQQLLQAMHHLQFKYSPIWEDAYHLLQRTRHLSPTSSIVITSDMEQYSPLVGTCSEILDSRCENRLVERVLQVLPPLSSCPEHVYLVRMDHIAAEGPSTRQSQRYLEVFQKLLSRWGVKHITVLESRAG